MSIRGIGGRGRTIGILGILLLTGCGASAPARPPGGLGGEVITVYKTPTCGCCEEYIRYLRGHGLPVHGVERDDLAPLKRQWGIPEAMRSCHTARIGPYVGGRPCAGGGHRPPVGGTPLGPRDRPPQHAAGLPRDGRRPDRAADHLSHRPGRGRSPLDAVVNARFPGLAALDNCSQLSCLGLK